MAIDIHGSMAVHPGPWLKRNLVDHHRMSVTKVADRLKVSRPAMSNLLNGRAALSPEMAIRFELAFGIPAETMLRMQTAHDLAAARRHEGEIGVDRLEVA